MKTIPFPQLCGKDYQPFSTKADAQTLINLYREKVQSGDGEFEYCLIKTPGLRRVYRPSGANGVFRGSIELNEHGFVVVDDFIYDFDADYSLIASYGPIANDGGPVFMAIDNVSLAVVSANLLHVVQAGALTTPATPVPPIGVITVRGYWVIVGPPTPDQVFYYTVDPLTWSAFDFQSTEGAPNNIIAMIVDHEELVLVGNRITQPFSVGTDPDTPFVPRQDAVIMEGTVAASSVCKLGDAIFMIGRNKNGERTVVRMVNYAAGQVSTYATSNTLRKLARVDDAIAMAFQLNGHEHVWFTFPEAGRTLGFDATENDWYEVAGWNVQHGRYERHRGNTMMAAFGKILVGDHSSGWMYELSPDFYDDADVPIRYFRETPHVTQNGKRVEISKAEVFAEAGMGLSPPRWLNDYSLDKATFDAAVAALLAATTISADQATTITAIYDVDIYDPDVVLPGLSVMSTLGFFEWGTDPLMTMQVSFDGGKTWGDEYSRSLGKVGEYKKQMIWNRVGSGFDPVFRFFGDSPTKIVFTGAALDVEVLS